MPASRWLWTAAARRWLAGGTAILGVAAATLTSLLPASVRWLLIVLTLATGALSLVSTFLDEKEKKAKDDLTWVASLEGVLRYAKALPVRDADPYTLGVEKSTYRLGEDPYVPRNVDAVIRAALQDAAVHPMIVIVGRSKAGKSRTAYEAVLAAHPDSLLVAPRREASDLEAFLNLWPPVGLEGRPCVFWMDGLNVADLASLSPTVLEKMRAVGPVVGTIEDAEVSKSLQWEPSDPLAANARATWNHLTQEGAVIGLPFALDSHELALARIRYPQERFEQSIGEALIAGGVLMRRWQDACTTEPIRYALVHAAVDWRRCVSSKDPDRTRLTVLVDYYMKRPVDVETFDAALSWALTPIRSRVALLSHTIDSDTYHVLDYVVAAASGEVAAIDVVEVNQQMYEYLLDHGSQSECIGAAQGRQDPFDDVGHRLLERARSGPEESLNNLATLASALCHLARGRKEPARVLLLELGASADEFFVPMALDHLPAAFDGLTPAVDALLSGLEVHPDGRIASRAKYVRIVLLEQDDPTGEVWRRYAELRHVPSDELRTKVLTSLAKSLSLRDPEAAAENYREAILSAAADERIALAERWGHSIQDLDSERSLLLFEEHADDDIPEIRAVASLHYALSLRDARPDEALRWMAEALAGPLSDTMEYVAATSYCQTVASTSERGSGLENLLHQASGTLRAAAAAFLAEDRLNCGDTSGAETLSRLAITSDNPHVSAWGILKFTDVVRDSSPRAAQEQLIALIARQEAEASLFESAVSRLVFLTRTMLPESLMQTYEWLIGQVSDPEIRRALAVDYGELIEGEDRLKSERLYREALESADARVRAKATVLLAMSISARDRQEATRLLKDLTRDGSPEARVTAFVALAAIYQEIDPRLSASYFSAADKVDLPGDSLDEAGDT
jgi:hypothetical protein